ncbi:MAG: GAF domain-containing protein [Chloroflexi bacterium]|nr:GAF domain-containing protein [Chloroflexota bacterium]
MALKRGSWSKTEAEGEVAVLEEERERLRRLRWFILGLVWVVIIGREIADYLLQRVTLQESILSALAMAAVATVLVTVGFRLAAKFPTERQRLQESLVLLDIATAVSSTLDLTQMLKLIAQRTAEACQVHRCSILLFDEQRQRIQPLMSQYASGATDKELWERFRYHTYAQKVEEVPVLRRVIEDRQPLVLQGAAISALPEAWTRPFGIHSLLIVPLVARDCVIGIMALDHVDPEGRFAQDQINLAMTIGSQVAVALENARLYQQVVEEQSRLREIDRFKSNIVANVSHELRAPLSSIKAYTELLLHGADGGNGDLRREWLSVIDRETDHLTTLINDFLNMSRLEAGHFELNKVPLHLGEVVAEVVDSLRVQAEQRGITIDLEVQTGLPRLAADDNLMRIVVRNLVSNAIKFSHDGGHVRIRVWREGDALQFSVQDEGIGIPPEAIPHLFTKFFRVPTPNAASAQGTGLGLALAKEAVLAHGGRIDVESTPGKGSRFTVVLPLTGESGESELQDVSETSAEFNRHQ